MQALLRRWWRGLLVLAVCLASTGGHAQNLPAPVLQALRVAGLPADALAAVVEDAAPGSRVWVQHRAMEAMNPASTLKLVTTFAALDRLGPAYTWQTRLYADGPLRDGVLHGNLYLQGGGDPALVTEKLWLLLQRLRNQGVQRIEGDWVLDRSLWRLPPADPGAFDGEALRPYNATPDAVLVNFKAQTFTFTPDPASGQARIALEPPLAGVQSDALVPLSEAPCGNWRSRLNADFSDATRPRFRGAYPSACGVQQWPLAHPDPERFGARAVLGMWQSLGGQLGGRVRDGQVPAQAQPLLTFDSPPLAEVVRDVNKYSNNVMAQHVFLTLGSAGASPVTDDSFALSRQAVSGWWRQRLGPAIPEPVMDNGAGLSRDARITPQGLAALLQLAYASPWMPELMASLPVSGLDGTLRRSPVGVGLAHLKTGSLRDVLALAGYVDGPNGQRRVLVALVNHPNARAARPALDALVQWAAAQ